MGTACDGNRLREAGVSPAIASGPLLRDRWLVPHPDPPAAHRRGGGDRGPDVPLEILPDQLVLLPEQPLDDADRRAAELDVRVPSPRRVPGPARDPVVRSSAS